MFYGFGPPASRDVVFKVAGNLEKVRLLDHVARNVLLGAVQSNRISALRHLWANATTWMTEKAAGCVQFCRRHFVLRWLGLLLLPVLFLLMRVNIAAKNADFRKRKFVADKNGHFTLMLGGVHMEHMARACVSQLDVLIQSEKFPEGIERRPPVQLGEGSSATFSFTIDGYSMTLNLLG